MAWVHASVSRMVAGGAVGALLGVFGAAIVSVFAAIPAGAFGLLAPPATACGVVLGAAAMHERRALQPRLARAGCAGLVIGTILGVAAWVGLSAPGQICGDLWMLNAALYGGAFALAGGIVALAVRARRR